jgi:hypothetical protein
MDARRPSRIGEYVSDEEEQIEVLRLRHGRRIESPDEVDYVAAQRIVESIETLATLLDRDMDDLLVLTPSDEGCREERSWREPSEFPLVAPRHTCIASVDRCVVAYPQTELAVPAIEVNAAACDVGEVTQVRDAGRVWVARSGRIVDSSGPMRNRSA